MIKGKNMNNEKEYEFQKIWFAHIEKLITKGILKIEKNENEYILSVEKRHLPQRDVNYEKIFYHNIRYGVEKVKSLIVGELFDGEDNSIIVNKQNVEIFLEYKEKFLDNRNPIIKVKPYAVANENEKDKYYKTITEYSYRILETPILIFNMSLPLINYFENNDYSINEMFECLNTVGAKNVFAEVAKNNDFKKQK